MLSIQERARTISREYLTQTLSVGMFAHMRSEVTVDFPNCIFIVTPLIAELLAEQDEFSRDFIAAIVDGDFDEEKCSVGLLFNCYVMRNSDFPANVVIAVGCNSDFTRTKTRMRVIDL